MRRPDSLTNPQFWAEDATIFFRDQLLLGFTHSVGITSLGYVYLVPRLVAAFAAWFPIAYAPFLYNLAAASLASLMLSVFALPAYRFLIQSDYLRVAVCAIAAASFAAPEVIGNITNIQWYLTIGALVLLFYPVTEKQSESLKFQFAIGGLGFILVCSSPQTLILLPFVLWRIRPRDWRRNVGPALIIVGMVIQSYIILTSHPTGNEGGPRSLAEKISATVIAPIYRCILADVLGTDIAGAIAAHASLWIHLGAVLLLVLWLVWLFLASGRPAQWSILIAVYAMFASIAIVVGSRPFGWGFSLHSPWIDWSAGRYVVLGSMVFAYLAGLTLQRLIGRYGSLYPVVGLIALFAFGVKDHYSAPRFVDLGWPAQARQIESWIRAKDPQGIPLGVHVKLNPTPDWEVYLPARLAPASPESPWDGCLLRGRLPWKSSEFVYWIHQGKKVPVNADWIKAKGFRWDSDVRMIRQSEIDAIPDAR